MRSIYLRPHVNAKGLQTERVAQAIDYASDVAGWTLEKVGETCSKYTGKGLEDVIGDSFPEVDLETLSINDTQRILLVGSEIETSLERMVEWLSDSYGVNVNAIVLNYIRTASGDELITQTAIISEEVEQERIKRKKFKIPMSDEPGEYEEETLEQMLRHYLGSNKISAQRIRDVLLPACMEQGTISRSRLKEEFTNRGEATDAQKAGYVLSVISGQIGMDKNDFLRQVIGYDYPNYPWEKDNYCIRPEYGDLVQRVLDSFKSDRNGGGEATQPPRPAASQELAEELDSPMPHADKA